MGDKAETLRAEMFIALASTKVLFFIAVAYALWLLKLSYCGYLNRTFLE